MAIRYKDIVDKLESYPLSEDELILVEQAEEYIDNEILTKFGARYYEIGIDVCILNFDYSPKTKKPIDIKQPRKNLLSKELMKRYVSAGWVVTYPSDIDDVYVTFKGKKQ